jgi:hypothetical protein
MTRHRLDEPVSVVLPTREWTTACDELADQVGADDEFVVACDTDDDPVVREAADRPVEVVVAGEPEGCSAKCNALAAGLERATGECLVCTDADFGHDPPWLAAVCDRLADVPDDHVLSTAPVVLSEGPLMKPFEGPGAIGAVLTTLFDSTA